jgi:hypothetical protein
MRREHRNRHLAGQAERAPHFLSSYKGRFAALSLFLSSQRSLPTERSLRPPTVLVAGLLSDES